MCHGYVYNVSTCFESIHKQKQSRAVSIFNDLKFENITNHNYDILSQTRQQYQQQTSSYQIKWHVLNIYNDDDYFEIRYTVCS